MATSLDCVEMCTEESPIYESATGAGTTPGTGTTPYRLSTQVRDPAIQTFDIDPAPGWEERKDEVRGLPAAPVAELDQFLPTFSFTERCYLNDLAWWLWLCGFTATITAGDGSTVKDPDSNTIPVGATKWVLTRRSFATIQAQTARFQVARVGEGYFEQLNGAALNSLSMSAAGGLNGAGQGLYYQSIADPNLAPTFDAPTILQVRRRDWTVPTWYSNRGTLTDFSWALSCPLTPDRDPGVQSFFNTKLYYEAVGELTGSVAFSDFAPADMTQLLGGGSIAAKFVWKTLTSIGATSYKYSMWLEMPALQYRSGKPDALTNVRRKGASFNWTAGWDTVAGYDARYTIVCADTGIGSYV